MLALSLVVGFFVIRELRKPRLKVARLKPRKQGISHILFEKSWHPFVTAVLVALIAILAWPLSSLSGRNYGLGITTPSANLVQYLSTGDVQFVDWGVFWFLESHLDLF